MNPVLLMVSKAMDAGHIDADMAHDILLFVVEKKRRKDAAADESVALAELIRRGLVGATDDDDEVSCSHILEGLRNLRQAR